MVEPEQALLSLLRNMINKECWSVIGPSAGSWFSLHWGGKLPRAHPLANDKLRDEQRNFTGEYRMFFQDTWTFRRQKKIVCDCDDLNGPGEAMERGLALFEGLTFQNFSFEEPQLMELFFSDSHQLTLLPSSDNPDHVSYTLFGDGMAVSVHNQGRIDIKLTDRR